MPLPRKFLRAIGLAALAALPACSDHLTNPHAPHSGGMPGRGGGVLSEAIAPGELSPEALAIARWSFDESTGPRVVDGSGHGHDATLVGGVTRIPGVRGNAIALDGAGGHLTVPGGEWLTRATGTIEAWVWIDPAETGGRILSTETWGYENGLIMNWGFETSEDIALPNGGIFAGIHSNEGGGHYAEAYLDGVSRGEWHHVAFSWDDAADRIVLVVDGTVVVRDVAHRGIEYTGEPFTIGCWEAGSSQGAWFRGAVDEVRFLPRALRPEEFPGRP